MAKSILMAPHFILVAILMAIICFWAPVAHAAAAGRIQSNEKHSFQQMRLEQQVISSSVVNLSDPNLNQILTPDEIRSVNRVRLNGQNLSRGGVANAEDNSGDAASDLER